MVIVVGQYNLQLFLFCHTQCEQAFRGYQSAAAFTKHRRFLVNMADVSFFLLEISGGEICGL